MKANKQTGELTTCWCSNRILDSYININKYNKIREARTLKGQQQGRMLQEIEENVNTHNTCQAYKRITKLQSSILTTDWEH